MDWDNLESEHDRNKFLPRMGFESTTSDQQTSIIPRSPRHSTPFWKKFNKLLITLNWRSTFRFRFSLALFNVLECFVDYLEYRQTESLQSNKPCHSLWQHSISKQNYHQFENYRKIFYNYTNWDFDTYSSFSTSSFSRLNKHQTII